MSHQDWTIEEFGRFVEQNKIQGGTILDVGCRDKTFFEKFQGFNFVPFGCDISAKKIYSALGEHSHEVIHCDMHNLPYPDNSFDIVFSCHSFEHVENPSQVLREFKRICKPDGWIWIAMPIFGKKYIVDADHDHINVTHPLQMERFCLYVKGLKLREYRQLMNPENGQNELDNQIYEIKVVKNE